MRTSDRVFLEIAIILSGENPDGRKFVESTRALVLSRHGARIISRQPLVPEQRLIIRCLRTGMESDVRVVGPIMGKEEGCHYGVSFLDSESNIWGINFPKLDGTENPASRVFLECANCHAQEVAHLDVFELEVFLANACLTRPCLQCKAPTLWTRSSWKEESVAPDQVKPEARHAKQERKWPRINLKVQVCLHHPEQGQEVVATENVSRGGFRFRSVKDYPVATMLEAALPYSPGAANIFTPSRIVHKELAVGAKVFVYRVAYVPAPSAPSLTGLRITQPK